MDLTTGIDQAMAKARNVNNMVRFYSNVQMNPPQDNNTLTGHDITNGIKVTSSSSSGGQLQDSLQIKIPQNPKQVPSTSPSGTQTYRSGFESWDQTRNSTATSVHAAHVAQQLVVGNQEPEGLSQQLQQQGMTTSSSTETGASGITISTATTNRSSMVSPTGSSSSLSMSACESMSPSQLTLAQMRKRKRRPQPIPEVKVFKIGLH